MQSYQIKEQEDDWGNQQFTKISFVKKEKEDDRKGERKLLTVFYFSSILMLINHHL